MHLGGIGAPELIIVLVIVLVIFGVGRIPEVFGSLGKGIREFRKSQSEEPSPSTQAAEGQEEREESKTQP